MSLPVIILGAGGHAKVLINALGLSGVEMIGILDADEKKLGSSILGIEVIGNDEKVFDYKNDKVMLVNGIGTIKVASLRKKIFDEFRAKGYRFAAVIHPSAIISSDVEFGEGVQVMAGAVIQPGVRIGDNAIINTGAIVDHDCSVGAHAHISPGVTLSGSVIVGEGAHVGTGASVIQGITIGKMSLVAAGAVVVKDVAEGTVVKSVAAKAVAP